MNFYEKKNPHACEKPHFFDHFYETICYLLNHCGLANSFAEVSRAKREETKLGTNSVNTLKVLIPLNRANKLPK